VRCDIAFADRLNELFARARAQGRSLTNEDVERLTNGRISANHVWRLRNGRNHNPGLDTLQLLAGVFGVALDYFGGGDDEGDEDAIRRALARPELRVLVTRLGTADVTPRDAVRLAKVLDAFLGDATTAGANEADTPPDIPDGVSEKPERDDTSA